MGKQRDYTEMTPVPLGKWASRLSKSVHSSENRIPTVNLRDSDPGFRGSAANPWKPQEATHAPKTSIQKGSSVCSNEVGKGQATSKGLGDSNSTEIGMSPAPRR